VQVWYDVGSKDDPRGRSGFAHLFEHLMFKATRNMPSEMLDRLTEDVGGANNASTDDELARPYGPLFSHDLPQRQLPRPSLCALPVSATSRNWIRPASPTSAPSTRPIIGPTMPCWSSRAISIPRSSMRWIDRYLGAVAKPDRPIPRVTVAEPPRTGRR
jgi:zinc protease